MDDLCDELDVPDNWLELSSTKELTACATLNSHQKENNCADMNFGKREENLAGLNLKRKGENSSELGTSSPKRSKADFEQSNTDGFLGLYDDAVPDQTITVATVHSSVLSNGFSSHQNFNSFPPNGSPSKNLAPIEISSTSEISSPIAISDGTFEDTSVNEPDFETGEDGMGQIRGKHERNDSFDANIGNTSSPEPLALNEASDDNISNSTTKIVSKLSEEDNSNRYQEHHETISEDVRTDGLKRSNSEEFEEIRDDNKGPQSNDGNYVTEGNDDAVNSSSTLKDDQASELKTEVKRIASIVRDAKIISAIVPNKGYNEIYDLLLDNREREDRIDFVTVQLTNSSATSSTNGSHAVDIFEEVQQVVAAVPLADANEVYAILESLPPSPTRVNSVIARLKNLLPGSYGRSSADLKSTLLKRDSSIADDPVLKNDPLFRDMRTIAKMFPDKDRNEIYALLEANHNKDSRLQSVIDEILHVERLKKDVTATPHGPEDMAGTTTVNLDAIEDEVERMKNIFPDCDPNYLYEKLVSMKGTPNRTEVLAAEMFDKKDYPKLKDVIKKENEKIRKEKFKLENLTVEEFLKRFPDPVKTFGDKTKEMSLNYKQHAEIALKNDFPMLKAGYLKKVLGEHQGHFYPAYQEISTDVVSIPIHRRKDMSRFMKNIRSAKLPMPDTCDEYFFHELWFVHNEQSVLDYPKQKEEERRLKVEEAKLKGELYECYCCYDDECLFEELANCAEGHLFCKTCVIRSTEAAFGEMKTKFPCLTGECDQDIPLSTLQTIISANLFSKIVRRLQEEEVQQANIPDLVTCPFCPFATIMPNPDDKVFKCLNPDCLKESCRLCQEPNHVPLRCNEVEKKAATNMRTYIENEISEAVMRKCSKCGKRFVKDMGCNKMTCICGYTSCYACKAQGIDYDHFNHNRKCAEADPKKIHQRDMEEAAIRAKNQYLLDHPEAADIELKSDVNDMIKDYKISGGPKHAVPYDVPYDDGYDDGYEEYEEEYEDSDFEDEHLYSSGSETDSSDENENGAYYF